MNFQIRRATTDDAPTVGLLTRAAYAKWVPVIGREPLPMKADRVCTSMGFGSIPTSSLHRTWICTCTTVLSWAARSPSWAGSRSYMSKPFAA